MRIDKALRREKRKNNKKKMRIDGKSVFLIRDEKEKREEEIRKRRKHKLEILDASI